MVHVWIVRVDEIGVVKAFLQNGGGGKGKSGREAYHFGVQTSFRGTPSLIRVDPHRGLFAAVQSM